MKEKLPLLKEEIVRRLAIVVGMVVLGVASAAAQPATCPTNIPVVTLVPHQVGGFSWGPVTRPMNDPWLTAIAVDPTNDSVWYVGGENGLYMTKNSGLTWTRPLNGQVRALLLVPGQPQLIYSGIGTRFYLSRDKGVNWNVIRTFNARVNSVLVAGGRLYVSLAWSTHGVPSGVSGVWVSNLEGGGSTFHAFGPGQTGLIVWTLARDPQDGTLYAGTEIFDHPRPNNAILSPAVLPLGH